MRRLEVTATDDPLELFDTLMANELIGRAAKNADRETLRRHAGQARDTELLTKAVSVLLEAEEWGEDVPLDVVWAAIEKAVGSRERLRAAVARVQETAPPRAGSSGDDVPIDKPHPPSSEGHSCVTARAQHTLSRCIQAQIQRRFPGMLLSPSPFGSGVSHWTQKPPFEFLPAELGIRRSASWRIRSSTR